MWLRGLSVKVPNGSGDRHWATGEELMEVVGGWEVGRG